jgi:hypothetical protein
VGPGIVDGGGAEFELVIEEGRTVVDKSLVIVESAREGMRKFVVAPVQRTLHHL